MKLADLMKPGVLRDIATATLATTATDKPVYPPSVATVATVAVANTQRRAANDQMGDTHPGAGGVVDTPIRSVPRGRTRGDSPHASQARAQSGAVPAPMSTAEVDLFMARVERFTSRGLPGRGLPGWGLPGWAESLADRLLVRDREGDDRRMCIECRHCTSGRSCGRARAAGLSHQELGELAVMLQRCPTFAPAIRTEGARP